MFSLKKFYTSASLWRTVYRYYTDLSRLNFKHTFTARMERNRDGTFELEFPNLYDPAQVLHFSINEDEPLKAIIHTLYENVGDQLGKLKLFSYEKSELSQNMTISDLEGQNFYLISQKGLIFNVRNLDYDYLEEYQQLCYYAEDVELSFLERKILLNYIRRFDDLNEYKLGSKIFADSTSIDKPIEKQTIVKNLLSALPQHKNVQTYNEYLLFSEYERLGQRLHEMRSNKAKLEIIASQQVKLKMWLSLLALIVGTYHIWSWDIVEPMAYFINLGGVIFLSRHFFNFYDDYSPNAYYEWRKQKALEFICYRYSFNLEELNALEEQFKYLEKKIRANVLIYL